MLGPAASEENTDATPPCPSIRIRRGCGRGSALPTDELRHKLPPTQTSQPEASAAPTSAAQTSAEPTAACADVAALKSSLQALTNVKPAEDGLTALTSAIANVKTNLDTAQASASPALQPSVQQVKTAFAELQTAASGTNADNLKQKAPAIATAMKQVKTATQALSATLTQTCPGS